MISYETQADKERLFWYGYYNCKAKDPVTPLPQLKIYKTKEFKPFKSEEMA